VTPYQFSRDITDKSVGKMAISDRKMEKVVITDTKIR